MTRSDDDTRYRRERDAVLGSARAILEQREFTPAARQIFDFCRQLTGASSGYVALLSDAGDENEVLFLDAGGRPCTVDPELPMPIRGLREVAYREQRAVYDNRFGGSEWQRFMPDGHVGLDNVLFAPLILDGRAVGLIGLANKAGDFTDDDARIAGALGGLAAVALRNARTMEQLDANREQITAVMNTTADGVVAVDGQGRIIVWNDASERLFGWTSEEAVGQPLVMIVPEDQREDHRQAFGAFMGSGETGVRHRELELTAMHKDGHTLPVELSTVAWRAADGVYVTGILRDLTRRKRAEEERRKLDEKVQQVQKMESLGVLAGGIAHDFNNLLVSILGNADLALMDLPRESPARECIQDIRTASQRAADLSRQILAYSGKGRFVVEPLDLNMLIEELTHLLEATLAKDALLRLHLADPLPLVEGDATQLRQVIMNLITNASDSVGKRSGVITITTGTMECDRPYLSEAFLDEDLPEGRYTWLEVSDTGEGMDAATRERIFDPFFTTKSTGRGLGLAAVLGIVRGHRGAIHVYSEPGDGTTFKLLFPVHQEGAGLAPIAPEPVVDFRGSGAVLVVDDEDTVHAVTRRMLHRMGFEEILAARDGREALTLFDQRRDDICCILLDLTMPHMDGAATFRELRRLGAGIPVILVSGYNEQDVVNRFAGKGLAGFLQKPFEYSMLARKVQEAIDWSPRGAVDG